MQPLQPHAVASAEDAALFASLKVNKPIETLLPRGDANARARRHAMLLGREQPLFAAAEARLAEAKAAEAAAAAKAAKEAGGGPAHDHQQQHERALQFSGPSLVQLDVPPAPPLMPPPPEAPPPPPPQAQFDELHALTELYEAMGGPAWNTSANWLDGYPCEDPVWQGVVCTLGPPLAQDADSTPSPPPNEEWEGSGRVHRLILNGNNLNGTLPASLGKLRQLREISVHSNAISGYLPTALSGLTSLQRLVATSNQISGAIDTLADELMLSGHVTPSGWSEPVQVRCDASHSARTCLAQRPHVPFESIATLY